MRNDPVAPRLKTTDPQPLTSQKLRFTIHFNVVAIHCLLIFGPLAWLLYLSWTTPQETMFKVKLAGPLSTGEVVGPPSRLRPSNNPGPLPPNPGPPEPPSPPTPPRPVTPSPPPVPRQVAKPTPKPPPVPKQTAKPTPKPPPVPKQTAKQTQQQSRQAQAARNRRTQAAAKPRQLTAAEQVALARQNAGKYGDGGGSNFNAAVPIGDADRAQAYGKQNNGTPGGGGNSREEDAAYWTRLGNYVETRWTQPPGSLLGETRPTVTIELSIAADGRVTGSRIVQPSGNRAMDDSVQRMLANLDRVPAPSRGATSIQILLQTRD